MANTNTNTRINLGNRRTIQYITIDSDGTQETDLVVYDSSVVCAALGKTDTLNSMIKKISFATSGVAVKVKLEWDATTDILAWSLGPNSGVYEFDCFAGLKNTAGTGKTGDILLTTTGLASGDSLTLILEVDPGV